MLRKLPVLLTLICSLLNINGQPPAQPSGKITLLFAGDIMGHDQQIRSAENQETHTFNYDSVFTYIRDRISEADIAIGNLEVTLAGRPYRGYPQFSSPPELALGCKNAGFDFLVTANNHSNDRRKNGILRTIHTLDSLGIPHTGTFTDKDQRDSVYPAVIRKNGFTFSILNYTYGTNGIAVTPPVVVNLTDTLLIKADIQEAKVQSPDVIIAILHWGTEYDTIPSHSQEDLADFMLERGVDIIIGSHPHVLQKMIWIKSDEKDKDRVIVYSLGNFVSNQNRPGTDGGAMVRITLEKRPGLSRVSDIGYMLTWVYTPVVNDIKKFFILPCEQFENNPDFFNNISDYQKMMTFLKRARRLLEDQKININEIAESKAPD
jgi:poly-gamma-glutamate capsule biosynthesis protein CapA/YwtB (metallophosphatase superfamily)